MGRPITPPGNSWLYHQVLAWYGIPTDSGYIDIDLLCRKDEAITQRFETEFSHVLLDENSIIYIDKRAIDLMPEMPDTFGGKWMDD